MERGRRQKSQMRFVQPHRDGERPFAKRPPIGLVQRDARLPLPHAVDDIPPLISQTGSNTSSYHNEMKDECPQPSATYARSFLKLGQILRLIKTAANGAFASQGDSESNGEFSSLAARDILPKAPNESRS